MSAILRIHGLNLNVDEVLESTSLKPDTVWRKGDLQFLTKPHGKKKESSGLTVLVSNADFDDFKTQIVESTRFLEENWIEIRNIVEHHGVDCVTLDFGIELRDVPFHSDILPPSLIALAAKAGIWLELSHSPIADDQAKSEQDAPPNA